jgi:hypothetical protein
MPFRHVFFRILLHTPPTLLRGARRSADAWCVAASMDRAESEWPAPTFSLTATTWRPRFEDLSEEKLGGSVRVVNQQDLEAAWPRLPVAYGAQFDVRTRVGSHDAVVHLRLFDQAAAHGLPRHSLGLGVKVAKAQTSASVQVQHLPAKTRLLPFVILAKAEVGVDLVAVRAELERRGLGPAADVHVLEAGFKWFLYSASRSAAYRANTPAPLERWRGPTKPSCNLKMVLPTSAPRVFTGWFDASRTLKGGEELWAPYGATSDLHATIADERRARRQLEPAVNGKRRAMASQMAGLRTAKAAKRLRDASE